MAVGKPRAPRQAGRHYRGHNPLALRWSDRDASNLYAVAEAEARQAARNAAKPSSYAARSGLKVQVRGLTGQARAGLERRGLVEVDGAGQVRLTEKGRRVVWCHFLAEAWKGW